MAPKLILLGAGPFLSNESLEPSLRDRLESDSLVSPPLLLSYLELLLDLLEMRSELLLLPPLSTKLTVIILASLPALAVLDFLLSEFFLVFFEIICNLSEVFGIAKSFLLFLESLISNLTGESIDVVLLT